MADVIWSNAALTDLDHVISYIAMFDPDAADRIGRGLYDAGERLRDFPRRGRPAAGNRREVATVPPYILSYRIDGDTVTVLDIRHGRQASRDR